VSLATPAGVVFASDDSEPVDIQFDLVHAQTDELMYEVADEEVNDSVNPDEPIPEPPPVVMPPPVELPASPVLITGYGTSNGVLDFVQIYNNSSTLVHLQGWEVEYLAHSADGTNEFVVTVVLDHWLESQGYAVIAREGYVDKADLSFVPSFDTSGMIPESLRLIPTDHAPYQTNGNLFGTNTRYEMVKTAAGNYTHARPFAPVGQDMPLHGSGLYAPEHDAPIRVVEIFANPQACSPTDTKVECRNYIKLHNPTSDFVDVSNYRLRVGQGNQTAGINNAFSLSGVMEPGGYLVVAARDDGQPYNITASGGYVWLEDRYGLVVYEETTQAYTNIGGVSNRGLSWALDPHDNTWKWAVPNPYGANNFNVVREAAQTKSLAPCRDGQYRNPATNRCRAIAATSTLAPCREGQYRNPETNRCRSIASASSTLTPCREGQERNPETNRCRMIRSSTPPPADFPVEEVADSVRKFAGWWMLAGVGLLATSYAAWEWRHEMLNYIRRIGSFFSAAR